MKKANVVPVHKNGDKQVLRNYRPVSLLPTCGKIFERLICNSLFGFFIKNNLISSNQSCFKQGDSCIYQVLSINLLTTTLKLQVFLLIYAQLLIKFDTQILFLN